MNALPTLVTEDIVRTRMLEVIDAHPNEAGYVLMPKHATPKCVYFKDREFTKPVCIVAHFFEGEDIIHDSQRFHEKLVLNASIDIMQDREKDGDGNDVGWKPVVIGEHEFTAEAWRLLVAFQEQQDNEKRPWGEQREQFEALTWDQATDVTAF